MNKTDVLMLFVELSAELRKMSGTFSDMAQQARDRGDDMICQAHIMRALAVQDVNSAVLSLLERATGTVTAKEGSHAGMGR